MKFYVLNYFYVQIALFTNVWFKFHINNFFRNKFKKKSG